MPRLRTCPARAEALVAGPQVITRQDDRGHKLEPFEDAIIEVPEEHMGQARGCARSPAACSSERALQATGRILPRRLAAH